MLVFVVDVWGFICEILVFDMVNKCVLNFELCEFVGVSEILGCVVDDYSKIFYLSEGELGIW